MSRSFDRVLAVVDTCTCDRRRSNHSVRLLYSVDQRGSRAILTLVYQSAAVALGRVLDGGRERISTVVAKLYSHGSFRIYVLCIKVPDRIVGTGKKQECHSSSDVVE